MGSLTLLYLEQDLGTTMYSLLPLTFSPQTQTVRLKKRGRSRKERGEKREGKILNG